LPFSVADARGEHNEIRADAQDLIIILRLTGLGGRMRRQSGARQYDADETSKC